MPRLRVHAFSLSLDGYGAGRNQNIDDPFAGLVDELHLAMVPILLGTGERLLDGVGDIADRYECSQLVSTETVAHVVLSRR